MADHLEGETIAAIATPQGIGGIGVVRVSGEGSKSILDRIFKPNNKARTESHKARAGWIVDNHGDNVDKVLILYMKGPNSYTGEDVVEISCHGGPRIIKEILDLTIMAGARLANRGEFTKRALLNGKIDLTQAEAVIDLITAKTKEALKAATKQLGGGLSEEIRAIKTRAMDLLSQLEASIDFPDEISDIKPKDEGKALSDLLKKIDELITTSDYGRLYREGATAAIIGKPNVGKSSLLNALLKEERAIVTDIPGTTRDTLEEGINIKGIPINLIDTAGYREASDKVEKLGVERAKGAANSSDVAMIVIDSSQPLTREDMMALNITSEKRSIIVFNKVDLGERVDKDRIKKTANKDAMMINTSAIKGKGIKELENAIYEKVTDGVGACDRNVYVNSRHKQCLVRAKESLLKCLESVKNNMAADFISIDLKTAVSALGEITGEEVSEEVINSVFERFCVGK